MLCYGAIYAINANGIIGTYHHSDIQKGNFGLKIGLKKS